MVLSVKYLDNGTEKAEARKVDNVHIERDKYDYYIIFEYNNEVVFRHSFSNLDPIFKIIADFCEAIEKNKEVFKLDMLEETED